MAAVRSILPIRLTDCSGGAPAVGGVPAEEAGRGERDEGDDDDERGCDRDRLGLSLLLALLA